MYIPEELISLLATGLVIFIIIVICIKRRDYADYWGQIIRKTTYSTKYDDFINAHPNWGRYRKCKRFVDAVGKDNIIEQYQRRRDRDVEMEKRRLRKEGYDQAMHEMKEAAQDNS